MNDWILALDYSASKFGWAILQDGKLRESGWHGHNESMGLVAAIKIKAALNRVLSKAPPQGFKKIIVEAPAYSKNEQGKMSIGASRGILFLVLAEAKYTASQFKEVAVTTWRKTLTGSGKSTKEDVRNTLDAMFGITFPPGTKDDEWEAVGIGLADYMEGEDEIPF
jgi:Holliday junction resolvasome RuvABC endonuclease subunit